jgi:hypothetical protein
MFKISQAKQHDSASPKLEYHHSKSILKRSPNSNHEPQRARTHSLCSTRIPSSSSHYLQIDIKQLRRLTPDPTQRLNQASIHRRP